MVPPKRWKTGLYVSLLSGLYYCVQSDHTTPCSKRLRQTACSGKLPGEEPPPPPKKKKKRGNFPEQAAILCPAVCNRDVIKLACVTKVSNTSRACCSMGSSSSKKGSPPPSPRPRSPPPPPKKKDKEKKTGCINIYRVTTQ